MLRYSSGMPTDSTFNPDDLMLIVLSADNFEWRVQWVDRQFCLSASRVGIRFMHETLRSALSPPDDPIDSRLVLQGLRDDPEKNDPPFFWLKWPLGFPVTVKFAAGNGFEMVLGFNFGLASGLLMQCDWILGNKDLGVFDARDLDER